MSVMPTPLKWYRKLSTVKGRREAGAFIIEGEKAIYQIISARPDQILEILTIREPLQAYRHFPVRTITESQCNYICTTRTPQGTMAVVRIPEEIYSDSLPDNTGKRILLMDGIQDPGNAGSLIRTAAAFDFSGIIMSDKCADPLSPKCIQAASGTVLSVWIRRTSSYVKLTRQLKDSGFSIIAADVNGDDRPIDRPNRLVLALGSEGSGLSGEILDLADFRLYIPIKKRKAESLNVAACGAILMYLSTQQFPTK
jgi:TrmH family RNA methyltransferase